ncbi:hypothetical protein OG216_07565 [Streptomycetaceae bacterium NBC_01309]
MTSTQADIAADPPRPEGPTDDDAPPPTPASRMSVVGRAWRALAATVGIVLIVYGTTDGTDDNFPFAPMSMFAFRTDPNGFIDSHYLEADTDQGQRIRVDMSNSGIGMSRAQLEGQLYKIVPNPALLQILADTQRRNAPTAPHYVRIYVMRDRTVLKDGATDHKLTEQLAEWTVR